jgi:ATP-dependent exoDNAse (exonuclease V) beta subunit
VAYVAATRPKDDLLITFASTKPSEFLWEIALNPRYRNVEDEDLGHALTSAGLHLERARVVLKQLEVKKQEEIGFFRELTKIDFAQAPGWLRSLLNKIQLWRIDRALKRIEDVDRQIKVHKEGSMVPLEQEIQSIEEEGAMRARLLGQI